MDEKLRQAVIPLLFKQRGKPISLEECAAEARAHGVRVDLVILLVRHELPLAQYNRSGLFPNLFVDVAWYDKGGIYHDDHEVLEALQLVAQALDKTLTVQVIERRKT